MTDGSSGSENGDGEYDDGRGSRGNKGDMASKENSGNRNAGGNARPGGGGEHSGTFYEAVGGSRALHRLVDGFYAQVLVDPLLAPVFANFTPTHIEHVVVWLSEVFGGPAGYTERLGGHHALLVAHLNLRITEEQRLRWVELMLTTAGKELPADELLQRRFAEYVEWGTKIARSMSQQPEGTDVGDPGPVPHWGWNGLAPSGS